jgi:hypothetical protein
VEAATAAGSPPDGTQAVAAAEVDSSDEKSEGHEASVQGDTKDRDLTPNDSPDKCSPVNTSEKV